MIACTRATSNGTMNGIEFIESPFLQFCVASIVLGTRRTQISVPLSASKAA